MVRLQKWMAEAGVASRRESEKWILSGYVKVNGKVVTTLGVKIDPSKDRVEVKGKTVTLERKRTFLFYKPLMVITSMSDPQGRKVVSSYFRAIPERLYPVGRLDFNTEGLLLMTNDGELAHRLMHPRYETKKEYMVTVKGKLGMEAIQQLQSGVELEDGWTAGASVKLLKTSDKQSKMKMWIHEGRNRQIRRMCDAVGHPVIHLARTGIGFLRASGLKAGQYRELTTEEIRRLKGIR